MDKLNVYAFGNLGIVPRYLPMCNLKNVKYRYSYIPNIIYNIIKTAYYF